MTEHTAPRPAAVTIIGLSFLSLAVLVIVYGTMSLAGLRWLRQAMNSDLYVRPEEFPPVLGIIFGNFTVFEIVTIVHIGLAASLLVAAISFLSLRAWARTALEIVSWIGLFYTGIQALIWPFFWDKFLAQVKVAGSNWYGPFSLFAGGVVLVASLVSLVFVIRALRSPTIRAAMRDRSPSSGSPMPPCLPRQDA